MIVDLVEPNNHIVVFTNVYKVILHEDGSVHIGCYVGSLNYQVCRFFDIDDYVNIQIRKE